MAKSGLAIFGGKPQREKEFSSKPMVNNDEINIVTELMENGKFSKLSCKLM